MGLPNTWVIPIHPLLTSAIPAMLSSVPWHLMGYLTLQLLELLIAWRLLFSFSEPLSCLSFVRGFFFFPDVIGRYSFNTAVAISSGPPPCKEVTRLCSVVHCQMCWGIMFIVFSNSSIANRSIMLQLLQSNSASNSSNKTREKPQTGSSRLKTQTNP